MNALRTKSSVILSQHHITHFSCFKKTYFDALVYCYFNLKRNKSEFSAVQCQLVQNQRCVSAGTNHITMASGKNAGVKLCKVVAELETFAPKSLAESWDNVGLLVEPASPKLIKQALLTIDLTGEVMEEALDLSVDLIISYHPPIFTPLKSVTMRTWKERLIALCLQNKIAVYSPHTSYDAKIGGVNDWLAAAFDTKSTVPLTQSFKHSSLTHRVDFIFYKCENVTSDSFVQMLRRQNVREGGSFRIIHCGEMDTTTQLTLECSTSQLATVTKTFSDLLPTNMNSSLSITKVEQEPIPGFGMGRLCELAAPITVKEAVQLVKQHIGIPHLRLALGKHKQQGSKIYQVALCAGSGGSVLRGCRADLWLTGEMQHHDILEATQRGTHVILCNHSDSERGYLKQLAPQLSELFGGKISFLISTQDQDPLKTV